MAKTVKNYAGKAEGNYVFLRGARIANGLELPQHVDGFLTLLSNGEPSHQMPSYRELEQAKTSMAIEAANNHIKELFPLQLLRSADLGSSLHRYGY